MQDNIGIDWNCMFVALEKRWICLKLYTIIYHNNPSFGPEGSEHFLYYAYYMFIRRIILYSIYICIGIQVKKRKR